MPTTFRHEGLCVGPMTPMKENGDINYDLIPQYVEHLVKNKINAVFLNGTTAEGVHLTIAERKQLAEKWIECGKGRLKFIVHCGAIALRDAQDLARHAEEMGVDAIAAIPSFYFPPRNPNELVQQLKEIANAAPKTPFIYYHTPRSHLNTLDIAGFVALAKEKIPTFAGLKWADSNAADANKCLTKFQDDVVLMWAEDDTLLAALSVGVKSFNGSTYSLTAPIAHRIIEAYKKGDWKTAECEQLKLKKTVDILEKNGDWLSRHKAAATMIGLPMGQPRLPVLPLSKEDYDEIEKELTELGFFEWIK